MGKARPYCLSVFSNPVISDECTSSELAMPFESRLRRVHSLPA